MPFERKRYQQQCLEVLANFLSRCTEVGAKGAFNELDEPQTKYREVPQLPGLPYVCLRVPTGGGKTFLAAHSVGVAARKFLHADQCVVLWLAPTREIVGQTLKALRNRAHPYRQALDSVFGGAIEVMTLPEALYVTRATLDGATTIIVSTLAAMRVEDTDGRKVYEPDGALQHHFSGLAEAQLAELEEVNGVTPYSLANVLRLRRPLVIMDEAHNARTELSFDTLSRVRPSCIVEFTATPDQERSPSNVLHSVSAAELKAEEMVKLPIRMVSRTQWKEAVDGAIVRQRKLEEIAKKEEKETGEYIRPIVLFQAQPRREGLDTITVDRLRQSLLEDFKIPPEEIAEGTGNKRELPDNILARECPVRYVLTVAALREGWDCPFAYVLCSVSNLSSKGAVEQILGRILRLPGAKHKRHEELNVAYAFATSGQFVEAAKSLEEALVDSGFTRFEAHGAVEPDAGLPFGESSAPLFVQAIAEPVTTPPRLESLPKDIVERIRIEPPKPGTSDFQLVYVGPPLTTEEANSLGDAFITDEDKKSVERVYRRSWGKPVYPAAMGEKLEVPQLAVRQDGQLEIFEDQFRAAPWELADCDPYLTEGEFSLEAPLGHEARIDVDREGKSHIDFVHELAQQLSFNDVRGPKTESELATWLDQAIDHRDITQTQSSLYLRRMVDVLVYSRGLPLVELVAARFRLRDVAEKKIDSFRKAALAESYQRMLLPDAVPLVEVNPDCCFQFLGSIYPANRFYDGPIDFKKHYYERPAYMNEEEASCAAEIDNLPQVKRWVKNVERQPEHSFWLQTATDRFYPDFVALLHDGRHLVVEFKGEGYMTTDDTKEKRMLGELWEARSNGLCVFRLVGIDDMESAIRAAVS
jgi:type III restriction enzyme